jgi:hypothetical protein
MSYPLLAVQKANSLVPENSDLMGALLFGVDGRGTVPGCRFLLVRFRAWLPGVIVGYLR